MALCEFQASLVYILSFSPDEILSQKAKKKSLIQDGDTTPSLKQNRLEPRGWRPQKAQLLWCGQKVFLIPRVKWGRGFRGLCHGW